ncbi:MAG: DNA repair protein RecN [Bifidobacteriaceae bacterium]|jgi:DNA repair protein RecN (Recombination protein N)|nr:DNA repair protein RecN [Bifidobacteriaceae bacterium]
MLRELEINSLGVIQRAKLALPPGLTAITGETGAGKTMLLGALAWLAGGRADSSLVAGERAQVSGVFQLPPEHPAAHAARAAGAELEDGELIAARSVSAQGRSRAHLGGVAAPSTALAASIGQLVAVHGQADQLRLRSPAQQRDLLDAFGGVETAAFRQLHDAAEAASARLAAIESQDREAVWEADALRRALREIDAVAPAPGEETDLPARIERLAHAEDLRQAADSARAALMGADEPDGAGRFDALGPGATAALESASRALAAGASRDAALQALAGRAAELAYLASDLGAEVAAYGAALAADPAELAALQERRAALGALLRKYGATASAVIDWAAGARSRLDELDVSPERRQRLADQASRLAAQRDQAAAELTEARRRAGRDLARAVRGELAGLGMGGARFAVALAAAPAGPAGADAVEFQFSAHGGALRPLAKGASGGELSRVMLALEVAALQRAGGGEALTLVFDEVDQGVGGAAALALAERLARLARAHQVLAVTHLPQIAAAADHHVVVAKTAAGGAVVQSAEGGARLAELARMLAGLDSSEAARQHAAELLARDWVGESAPG